MTYTVAVMEVSQATYDEIRAKLIDAGYDHALLEDGMLDMTHIALRAAAPDCATPGER